MKRLYGDKQLTIRGLTDFDLEAFRNSLAQDEHLSDWVRRVLRQAAGISANTSQTSHPQSQLPAAPAPPAAPAEDARDRHRIRVSGPSAYRQMLDVLVERGWTLENDVRHMTPEDYGGDLEEFGRQVLRWVDGLG